MSTEKYESAANFSNEQSEVTQTSAREVSKGHDDDAKFGTPYIVERSNGGYSIMYESPNLPIDSYGNPVQGYRELVGTAAEMKVDALGRPVLDDDGGEQYFLPSKIIADNALTPEAQRKLAESYGMQYGELLGAHPGDSPLFTDHFMNKKHRQVSDELLRIVHQPHFVERSDGTLDAMYESPILPVDEEGKVVEGYVEVVSVTPEVVRDSQGSPVFDSNGRLQHFLPSKIVSIETLKVDAQRQLAQSHGRKYEDLMDIHTDDLGLLREYFEKQVHRQLGRGVLHLADTLIETKKDS